MAIQQMTRAEYEQKYGAKPLVPTGNQSMSSGEEPTKTFGQKVMGVAKGITKFVGAEGIAEQYGATIAKARLPKEQRQYVEEPGLKKVVGSAIQTGAMLIPGAGMGAKLATKAGFGAATGYAMDVGSKLQYNQPKPLTPGIGTAVGAGLPVAGAVIKPAVKIIGRLFKGIGSGLSGVSTDTINKIIENPRVAQQASQKLATSGNRKILEENTKTLINGVSKIKNQASSAYRAGLDALSDVDIKPEKLKTGFFSALEKNKIGVDDMGKIDFNNADFLDPRIQQKAETIINKINQQKDLTGTGVRKLMDMVDNSRFKTAPDGDRQAFNALIGDLKQGLKKGIDESTDKLSKINAQYSTDLQLAETAEDIFGSVNFKNLPEVVKASKKLESFFAQTGLAPDVIDDFLTRIGESPTGFRTSEAVRQITNKTAKGVNAPGLSIGEITQTITGSAITPQMVKSIAIKTGLAREKLLPFLRVVQGMKTPTRNALLQALLSGRTDNPQ